MIGDVLILVTERVQAGSTLQSGQGYLVPDYPQTAQVLETRAPRTLTLDDPDVDAGEAAILRGLGYGSLVMLPLEINGSAWGLVEVYRIDRRPFTDADVKRARRALQDHLTTTSAEQPWTSARARVVDAAKLRVPDVDLDRRPALEPE